MYLASTGAVPMERTKILSTGGMVTAAAQTTAKKVLVATETGMIHQLNKANPLVIFEPVNRAAVCKYMKMITPGKLLRSLQEMTRRGDGSPRRRRARPPQRRADDRDRHPVTHRRMTRHVACPA